MKALHTKRHSDVWYEKQVSDERRRLESFCDITLNAEPNIRFEHMNFQPIGGTGEVPLKLYENLETESDAIEREQCFREPMRSNGASQKALTWAKSYPMMKRMIWYLHQIANCG